MPFQAMVISLKFAANSLLCAFPLLSLLRHYHSLTFPSLNMSKDSHPLSETDSHETLQINHISNCDEIHLDYLLTDADFAFNHSILDNTINLIKLQIKILNFGLQNHDHPRKHYTDLFSSLKLPLILADSIQNKLHKVHSLIYELQKLDDRPKNVSRYPFFKSLLCSKFLNSEVCRHYPNCIYAHNGKEIQDQNYPINFKLLFCKFDSNCDHPVCHFIFNR
ncbi:uncharacterized protein ASCRUDRAFT_97257 [Ascoidea rubescens DSM 1968]|uniref:C3H1-type domain-containing protein n=1 Tax=Ascoidea rubescens DSM 1968 TaxID=1344418 RepID=A0A1D2VPR7_9ASCO|nr:hypothetical protein ASCRUDRAFT_97257 [Ascoidea rubescens DSM 1968]ODV63589.1 hypothetical protein ASCRUDRAFT_97257 [Ascoidea rubescens DSM 1968]